MKQRGWFWLVFLILIIGLLTTLATRFNVLLILSNRKALFEPILATLGFIVILAGFIILFARLAQEMRLNQLQSEFLAAVTHELKTPLATIELSSSLLQQNDLDPKEREQLWKSHKTELDRLQSEVEDLLEAARWDAKAIRTKRDLIDLEAWLVEKMGVWKTVLGDDGLFTREGDRLPNAVRIDAKMFDMICKNLIENARKFSLGKLELKIRTTRNGKFWGIEFIDGGLGFSPKESKKIFKRFYRAKHTAPYSISGTGLGLYLAKSACKRMRIKITAESVGPGTGATFRLTGKASSKATA